MEQKAQVASTQPTINKYARSYVNESTLAHNSAMLRAVGCSPADVTQFASRPFEALPAWIRRRFKKATKRTQDQWATINPIQGQKAFYMNKSLLPRGPQAKGARA